MNYSVLTKRAFATSLLLGLLLLLVGRVQPQSTDANFDETGVFLLETPAGGLYEAFLSPQNNYLLVYSTVFELSSAHETEAIPEYQASILSVWATRDLLSGIAEPSARYELSLSREEGVSGLAGVSISHDDSFVAIHAFDEILILSLPELVVIHRIPVQNWSPLEWSVTEQSLLYIDEGEVRLWDMASNRTRSYRFDYQHRYFLKSFEFGWILDNRPNEEGIAFSFCTRLLETCHAYEGDNQFNLLPTSDGQEVLVPIGDVDTSGQVQVWEFQDEQETYHQTIALADTTPPLCPSSFSPENQYLFSFCENVIWDYEALEIIQELGQGQSPAWLTEAYFLATDIPDAVMNLYLYHLGNETPISSLPLAELLGTRWSEILEANRATLSLAGRGRIHVSAGDDFAIADLDWAVVFVPILWD